MKIQNHGNLIYHTSDTQLSFISDNSCITLQAFHGMMQF
jgi:hypothetical protein